MTSPSGTEARVRLAPIPVNRAAEPRMSHPTPSETSELGRIIPPEIKDDASYRLIRDLAAAEDLRNVLEIGSSAGAIERIKAEHGIERFDMVLIDGSEFTGEVELGKVLGAKLILLDGTNTFKCSGRGRSC
jgi:hypothetical protein